jgi:hypothetical protein
MLAEAFHDLHGSRLHGFALLVTLGDARRAELAAGEALAAGSEQASALRHPERAAAWLRARALRALRHGGRHPTMSEAARRAALASLGVDAAAYEGLAALSIEARAALVASGIERFETIDVETILGAGPSRTRRMIGEARAGYVAVVSKLPGGQSGSPAAYPAGQVATRVRSVAARAMTAEAASQ